ncbi:hypothetical protein DFH08DRAFT_878872 [Mycena albidolilacea]|uniref:Uncharacterized protein n=1 Tax=Mycena albidolilacea TaxID=1033008 RepID=A0AAD7EL83_9AGAR|nr:hypothetical protein DFH08DRAFT_878872 [Mycena albidolilacea]
MDDPTVARRLEDSIHLVGTCTDICPRFERYRREGGRSLRVGKNPWHKRAVKKFDPISLPSDLRPPDVLKLFGCLVHGPTYPPDRAGNTGLSVSRPHSAPRLLRYLCPCPGPLAGGAA